MRRRRRVVEGVGLNLDPLADMLANSIGILLIVIIYAVLAARGTFISRSLPFQVTTTKESVSFLVLPTGIHYAPLEAMLDDFFVGLPGYSTARRQLSLTYHNIPRFVDAVNKKRLKRHGLEICAEADYDETSDWPYMRREVTRLILHIDLKTRDEVVGLTELADALPSLDKNRQWILFYVAPDAIPMYQLAKDLTLQAGLQINWMPWTELWPVPVSLVPPPSPGQALITGPQVTGG